MNRRTIAKPRVRYMSGAGPWRTPGFWAVFASGGHPNVGEVLVGPYSTMDGVIQYLGMVEL
jgi:hypothetical protein